MSSQQERKLKIKIENLSEFIFTRSHPHPFAIKADNMAKKRLVRVEKTNRRAKIITKGTDKTFIVLHSAFDIGSVCLVCCKLLEQAVELLLRTA